jgi:hypothetical protein
VLLPDLHYQNAEYYTEAPKYYTTEAHTETTQLRMLPQPTTPRLQLITPLKLSEYYTGAPKYDRSQSSEILRHATRQHDGQKVNSYFSTCFSDVN